MAAEQGARALVLEHTFSRMTEAARAVYPYFPVNWFMRNRYNSVKRIQNYHGPIFQCHGAADEVVPIALARKLHAAIPGKTKHFFEITNGRHNDTLPPRYYEALAAFLDRTDAAIEGHHHVRVHDHELVS
jgi:pimeloyl-ACP methyl ester carboxylesterase